MRHILNILLLFTLSFTHMKGQSPVQNEKAKRTWETEGRAFWNNNLYDFETYAFLRKPNDGRNFWVQPPKYHPSSKGRTEEELSAFEKRVGYKLPELFRQHMKQQNGGTIRYESYVDENTSTPVLYDSDIQPIPAIDEPYETLSDVYGSYMDREMWDAALGENSEPDRLYVLSYMDGHQILCLDYGVNEPQPRQEPEVVWYNTEMDFTEDLRVKNYREFVEKLVYNDCQYYIGLKTEMTLDEVMKQLSRKMTKFKKKMYNPQYGRQDFDYHYEAELNCGKRKYFLRLMPNQYRGGNYIFQDDTEYKLILEVTPSDGHYGFAMVGPEWIERITDCVDNEQIETKIILPQ